MTEKTRAYQRQYMRDYRARKRAASPKQPPPVAPRTAVEALDASRKSLHLSAAAMSAVVGKRRAWWGAVITGRRLLQSEHDALASHLRNLILQAGKNAP